MTSTLTGSCPPPSPPLLSPASSVRSSVALEVPVGPSPAPTPQHPRLGTRPPFVGLCRLSSPSPRPPSTMPSYSGSPLCSLALSVSSGGGGIGCLSANRTSRVTVQENWPLNESHPSFFPVNFRPLIRTHTVPVWCRQQADLGVLCSDKTLTDRPSPFAPLLDGHLLI